MSTQGPNPLPPTTILTTKSISQSAAHDFLAAYLDRANTDPALQPNASISEHGPVSRTTAAAPNLILHNLKRVQAGLAGEVLGRDLTALKFEDGGDAAQQPLVANNTDDSTAAVAAAEGPGWQDAQEWQQMDVEEKTEATDGVINKEERKRLKKERRLAEKRAKGMATQSDE